jgi:hypothetical protein
MLPSPRIRATARILIVMTGIASIWWAVVAMPRFRPEAGIKQIVEHIVAGETYKPDVLDAAIAKLKEKEPVLRPSILSKGAVVHLRQALDAVRSDQTDVIDSRLDVLRQAIDEALTRTPGDPLLWLVRFSVANTDDALTPERLDYLRLSYQLGPNEGWIAVGRNRLALAIYPSLPSDLAEGAISEFVGLVRSELYELAADNLAGPGWPIRHLLLTSLRQLSEKNRRTFAAVLNKRELEDVSVPGVDPPPARPWQH